MKDRKPEYKDLIRWIRSQGHKLESIALVFEDGSRVFADGPMLAEKVGVQLGTHILWNIKNLESKEQLLHCGYAPGFNPQPYIKGDENILVTVDGTEYHCYSTANNVMVHGGQFKGEQFTNYSNFFNAVAMLHAVE